MENNQARLSYYQLDNSGLNYLFIQGSHYYHSELLEEDKMRMIECDIEKKQMKIKEKNIEKVDWEEIDMDGLQYEETIDLSDRGDRWEGCSLNGDPFGYGCIYNSENQLVYKGFMYEGQKVCYGFEFYGDFGIVEYGGSFYKDMRYGYGKLYDKWNKLSYEGEWLNDEPIKERNMSVNKIKDKNIHFGIKELTIGTNCLKPLDSFRLCRYSHLEKVEIEENQMVLMRDFCIEECDELLHVKLCGKEQDTLSQIISDNVQHDMQSKKVFQIKNCKKLSEISIDQNWYVNCEEVILSSI